MRRRTRNAQLGAAVALAALLTISMPAAARAVQVGEQAPDFALETLGGATVRLDGLRGRSPVMLVFWATWCPVCRHEVPRVNGIADRFGKQGLEVLGVNVGVNDSARKAAAYREKYGVRYPLAFDEGSRVSRAFGVSGTPTVIILDRHGVVRYRGAQAPDDLAEHFDRLVR